MDALSLVFGVPAFDLSGLTLPNWTPSQTSEVPAALFMLENCEINLSTLAINVRPILKKMAPKRLNF